VLLTVDMVVQRRDGPFPVAVPRWAEGGGGGPQIVVASLPNLPALQFVAIGPLNLIAHS